RRFAGRRVRGRRHPRPLPRHRPARPRLLGDRSGPRQVLTLRSGKGGIRMPTVTALVPPSWQPSGPVPQARKWPAVGFDHRRAPGCFGGRRAYLIDGVIWEQGPMDPPHADGLEVVTEALRAVFGPGWRFRVQLPLHTGTTTNPMPDLAVVPGQPG